MSIPFFLSDNSSETIGPLGPLGTRQAGVVVEQAVDVAVQAVGVVALVVGIAEPVVRPSPAENIVGKYNNTTDHTVEYNSIAFRILDNCSSIITFHIQ